MRPKILTCLRQVLRLGLVAGVLSAQVVFAKPAPEQKCQAGKNIAAGRFAACMQTAEAKLATTGDPGKYAAAKFSCASRFATKWMQLERSATRAGVTCPDAPLEQSAVEAAINDYTTQITTALAGHGLSDHTDCTTCTTVLAQATSNLATCNGNLSTCNGNVATLSGNLSICTGSLTTCNAGLGTCTASLATANGSLTTCTGNLGTCTTSLATANGSLTTCNGSLSTCTGSLGTCNADLTTCTGTVTTLTG